MSATPAPELSEFITACGGVLEDPALYLSAEYQGRRVYFCSRGCYRAYLLDPDRFMSGAMPHPVTVDD